MLKYNLFLVYIFTLNVLLGQSSSWFEQKSERSHGVFVDWGYNISAYTRSDIRFTGVDYDFTFYGVEAKDRPTPFDPKIYLKLSQFTIPQYNLRIGFDYKGKWVFAFAVDHMKYVLNDIYQNKTVKGYINVNDFPLNENFDGSERQISNYLTIEHTDGLNYLNFEVFRKWSVLQLKNVKGKPFFEWNILAGMSLGVLLPKTNARVLGKERNDAFHLAGYGVSANIGSSFTFFRYLQLKTFLKGGAINMPDIITAGIDKPDRARQSFGFIQYNFLIGFNVPIRNQRSK